MAFLFAQRGEHSCSRIVGICLDLATHNIPRFAHGGFRLGIVAGLANVEGQAALHDRLVQKNVDGFGERHAQARENRFGAGFDLLTERILWYTLPI